MYKPLLPVLISPFLYGNFIKNYFLTVTDFFTILRIVQLTSVFEDNYSKPSPGALGSSSIKKRLLWKKY